MKTQFSKFVFVSILWLLVWTVSAPTFAQSQPRLGLQFAAGQPSLSVTGVVGTIYSIQYATNLSPATIWVDRTLLQAQGTNDFWSDPSVPVPSRRFYRAVSVAVPADTNLVFIQPGTFTMGSPADESERSSFEQQHTVRISRGFWMAKYLVTQGEYKAVTGSNPSAFTSANGYSDDLTLPVEEVSWSDATNYCALRTQQERASGRIATNLVYRLPTESEWEYAARAGTTTAFYSGTTLQSGEGNFNGTYEYDAATGSTPNATGTYLQTTTPVGTYAANGWGLYDMIGNVWELCQDWFATYPSGSVIDPQGPATGTYRVLRGGDWFDHAVYCRSADRNISSPNFKYSNIGLRVVLAQAQP
jgi:sulfatase modifying factor 1